MSEEEKAKYLMLEKEVEQLRSEVERAASDMDAADSAHTDAVAALTKTCSHLEQERDKLVHIILNLLSYCLEFC